MRGTIGRGPIVLSGLFLALAGIRVTGGADHGPQPPEAYRAPSSTTTPVDAEKPPMTLDVASPAFDSGDPIPPRYTCDGQNVSPPLRWSGVPEDAVALAVVADDPDAPRGTWVHWVLYGLDAGRSGLPEDVPARESVLDGALQGRNDFKDIGYGGPCPPAGQRHRYFFRVFALDARPDLGAGSTRDELLEAMDGHVLARGELMGTYRRR